MRPTHSRASRIVAIAVPALLATLLAACESVPTEPKARPTPHQVSNLDGATTDTAAKGPTMPWY